VIDIALRFGYESPEAFTRAFRQLHGVTPQAARAAGVKLAAFPRISFHVRIEGGDSMEYRIIDKPAFDILGKSATFGLENGEFKDQGRLFWNNYTESNDYKSLVSLTGGKQGEVSGAYVMTAYLPNEHGAWDPLVNVYGIEKRKNMDTGRFEVFNIPSAAYAEFYCTMKTSAAVNKRIYREWFPGTGHERDNKPDIAAFFQVPFTKSTYVRW